MIINPTACCLCDCECCTCRTDATVPVLKINEIKSDPRYEVNYANKTVGYFEKMDDGYFAFWPVSVESGYWCQEMMMLIAEKLFEMNKKWDDQFKSSMSGYKYCKTPGCVLAYAHEGPCIGVLNEQGMGY